MTTVTPPPPSAAGRDGTRLRVDGMTCQGCARSVTEALRVVPGVDQVNVALEQNRADVSWKPGIDPDVSALVNAVRNAGYSAGAIVPEDCHESGNGWSPLSGWRFNVVVGSILTLPLFVAEWIFQVGAERWYQWLAFVLVLPVQFICGARFYRGAWNQLKRGNSNMDTLVVLGSTTAFAYSAWGLLAGWHGHLFFMESAAIITLISVGHWVESKVSARAAKSLRALLDLAPPTARLLDETGAERIVPVHTLQSGQKVIAKPGDRIPIDGEVTEGLSAVDESMLTGESLPVDKGKGAKVFAGTANLHGWMLIRVSATGGQTALANIIAVVQRAQNSRANIQRLGDRVSNVFVPIVIVIALGTGLWWGLAPESATALSGWLGNWLWMPHHPPGALASAVYHAAAVLIIACPCAMGLATPVAIMAGTNVAAERGILIRDGLALEKTGGLNAVLFDKTGTLTAGQVRVGAVLDLLKPEEQGVGFHKIAATLAKPSQHPISQAVNSLSSVVLTPGDWLEKRGAGVEGRIPETHPVFGNVLFRLGSLSWLRDSGVDLKPGDDFSSHWFARGATVLGVSADGRLLGMIALRDTIKPHAQEVVQALIQQGNSVFLVTGDHKSTAATIADQAGIPAGNVFAEVRPEEKAALVQRLQQRGLHVAFVGDGINDAPALEQADLGIAVSRASDVAREAADIILLNSDIQAVPEALSLARATLRTIKQNLFWAFFYNAAAIPLAMLGFLSPVVSAFAMGFSDLMVIGNALRLRRWKPKR